MEDKLTQRLVGAIILISLAIIFVPLLLDGSETERQQMLQLPAPPDIDLAAVTLDDISARMKQMKRDSEAQLPREVPDSTDYADVFDPRSPRHASDFRLDRNNLPVSWSIQLASFQNQDNAVRLRKRLRAANYRSYILQSEAGMYRVLVGPMTSRESLAEIGRKLEESMQLKGSIVRYDIADDAYQLGG